MTRLATSLDRFAALVLGLLLILLGLGMLVWNTDWLPRIPQMITAPGLVTAAGTHWWPWALAGAGILLVLLALRWLITHTPKAKIKTQRLSGGENGVISVDLKEVAHGAAHALQQNSDIDSAKGKAIIDRGTRIIDLDVTANSAVLLTEVTGSIDDVGRQIAEVLGDVTIATRTTIHVPKHSHRERHLE